MQDSTRMQVVDTFHKLGEWFSISVDGLGCR
jgi:hypothetical protein